MFKFRTITLKYISSLDKMHYIMFKPFLCLWEHGILCGALIIEKKTGKKDKWMSEHCA